MVKLNYIKKLSSVPQYAALKDNNLPTKISINVDIDIVQYVTNLDGQ